MRALRLGIGVSLATVAVTFGLVGLLHLPVMRPLLHAGSAGCPIGMDAGLTTAELDAARKTALRHDRGDVPAASRPALGFVLDVTSSGEVTEWAETHGVSCASEAREIRCAAVPSGAIEGMADVDDLLLQFDAADRLVAVDASIREMDADRAAELVREMSEDLGRTAGKPSTIRGETSGDFLTRGRLSQTKTMFRFRDYRADVSATNVGGRIVVRATFQSVT